MYRIAVNDYIAKGGSGFNVLKRNTTRQETGISLRDSLIGYMQGFCTCDDLLNGREESSVHQRCGALREGKWVVDDALLNSCRQAQEFRDAMDRKVGDCTCSQVLLPVENAAELCHVEGLTPERVVSLCSVPTGQHNYALDRKVGDCTCSQVLKPVENAAELCNLKKEESTPEIITSLCSVPAGPYTGRCSLP